MHTLEAELARAGAEPARFGAGTGGSDPGAWQTGLDENLAMINAELDAPRPSRLARLLRRLGVDDLDVPLVTATPALRRSWVLAVTLTVLIALGLNDEASATGAAQILAFLTIAPLVPLAGVALAFGPQVDPTHDLVVAAPRDSFSVFLIRTATVLIASIVLLSAAAMLVPAAGVYRAAWLLPALALTMGAAALSVDRDPRRVAALVSIGWVGAVVVVTRALSAEAMFGAITQLLAAGTLGAATAGLIRRRLAFDWGRS